MPFSFDCTGNNSLLVCLCLTVIAKTKPRQHRQVERSCSREQQALFRVRVHEGELVSDDEGQVC